jgi:NAD(P)H-dependent FMN reductase
MFSVTLLDVAKKHMSTRPNVQPHVICSTPMQKAATAPCQHKLRLLSPWLHMPVARISEALNRISNNFVMQQTLEQLAPRSKMQEARSL